MKRDTELSIRIAKAMKARLAREANLRGESQSVIVRDALRQYFSDLPEEMLSETPISYKPKRSRP